jgi:hypothetical protein
MEVWKVIPGYEDYQVSDQGNVRSLRFGKTRTLRSSLSLQGRLQICLTKDGKKRNFLIHQLVAMSFLKHEPQGNQYVVDHINNNYLDNRLCNLQIVTQRYNLTKDKKRTLPTGVSISKSNKFIANISINGKQKYLGSFRTLEEASAAYQKALIEIK